jgi:hypothetical protein
MPPVVYELRCYCGHTMHVHTVSKGCGVCARKAHSIQTNGGEWVYAGGCSGFGAIEPQFMQGLSTYIGKLTGITA